MKYEIEVCTKESDSTTVKGQLLEKLASEILEVQQYKVVETVRVTGMEIDVLARHKISNSVIFVECKAWDNPLPADVITKLLGNVIFKGANEGWLITTGGLSKDAKGLQEEWESIINDKRHMLSLYTSDRIVELLLDAKIIKKCAFINDKLEEGYEQSDNALILITDIGKYWIIPVVAKNTGLVTSVVAFDAQSGKQIKDEKVIEELKNRKNKYSEYEWIIDQQKNEDVTKNLLNEYNSIVPIITGDSWNDYRPARPEDFVGRKQNIKEILDFFDNVIDNQTDTRLFAIKAPSGMGKSSLISKITAVTNGAKRRKRYFIYSVDVRTALSQRYAEFALRSCLLEAQKQNFLELNSPNFEITSMNHLFQENYFMQALDNLKRERKCIVLIFDQFEELFQKKNYGDCFMLSEI